MEWEKEHPTNRTRYLQVLRKEKRKITCIVCPRSLQENSECSLVKIFV